MNTRLNKILLGVYSVLILAISVLEIPRLFIEWRVGSEELVGTNIANLPSWVGPDSGSEFPWGIDSISDPQLIKFLEDKLVAEVIKTKDLHLKLNKNGKIVFSSLRPRGTMHLIALGLLLTSVFIFSLMNFLVGMQKAHLIHKP